MLPFHMAEYSTLMDLNEWQEIPDSAGAFLLFVTAICLGHASYEKMNESKFVLHIVS